MQKLKLSDKQEAIIISSREFKLWTIKKPKVQRSISEDRIEELTEREMQCLKDTGGFNFCMSYLSICVIDKQKFIIDGQHRYEVFLSLASKYEFDVFIMLYYVKSVDEMRNLFFRINESLPSPIVSRNVDIQETVNEVTKYFTKKYPSFFKTSEKPQKPNIKLEDFKQQVLKLAQNKKTDDCIEYIEKCNINIKNNLDKYILGVSDSILEKVMSANFYLGLDKNWN